MTHSLQVRKAFSFTAPSGDAGDLLRSIMSEDVRNPDGSWRATIVSDRISPRASDVDALTASARRSPSEIDFRSTWAAPGTANAEKRRLLEAVDAALNGVQGASTWRVLRRLGVLEVDHAQPGSRDRADCLRRIEDVAPADGALALYDALRSLVLREGRIAAAYDRDILLAALGPAARPSPPKRLRAGFERLTLCSAEALASIDASLDGLCLLRPTIHAAAREHLETTGVVRFVGAAGAGKTAAIARVCAAMTCSVVFLKEDRISCRTWSEHARASGFDLSARDVADGLGAWGGALLAIDGADRLLLSERRGVLADMLRAIQQSPSRSGWRIATSARDARGQDLVREILGEIGLPPGGLIEVAGLDAADTEALRIGLPRLAPLLARTDLGDRNRDLFTLREMLRDPSTVGTEVDMAERWATRGARRIPPCPERDATIARVADITIDAADRTVGLADLEPIGAAALANEGSAQGPSQRDAFVFAHDVYEDWALARALDRERRRLPEILTRADQPLWWIRAVRLAGQIALETVGPQAWVDLVEACARDAALDPSWWRTLLVAPLHSEIATRLLDDMEPLLLADDARLLERLVETLMLLETRPNEAILARTDLDLSEASRARYAAMLPTPVGRSWMRFLRWSLRRWRTWPARLVPRLTTLASTWLRATEGSTHAVAGELVAICAEWLAEIEDAHHPEDWSAFRDPFGHDGFGWSEIDAVEKQLRRCLALGVHANPDAVRDHLRRAAASRRLSIGIEDLFEDPREIPVVLPAEWVDLVIAFFVAPRPRVRNEGLSIAIPRFSSWDYNEGGLRSLSRSGASPRMCGFDRLFEAHEGEALRLLARLGMRAAVNYRHFMRQHDRLHPRPLRLRFAWGEVALWGDANTYRWARGALGPDVLGSIYMAMDLWMGREAAAGRPLEELFRLVLRPNGLNAGLVACVTAAVERAQVPAPIDAVGPILAEPRVWAWEEARYRDDLTLALQPWGRLNDADRRAVLALGARYAKRSDFRSALVLPFQLWTSPPARDTFRRRVAAWTTGDLVEFEEKGGDPDNMALLADRIERYAAIAGSNGESIDRNADADRGARPVGVPETPTGEDAEAADRAARCLDAMRLASWGQKALDASAADVSASIEDAAAMARRLGGTALFARGAAETEDEDFAWRLSAAGVAVAAAVVARHANPALFERERAWVRETLAAAAGYEREIHDTLVDSVILGDDPAVASAAGLWSLRARDQGFAAAGPALVTLATDRLHAVAAAVVSNASFPVDAPLARATLRAAFDACLYDIGPRFALTPDEMWQRQAAHRARVLASALADLRKGRRRDWARPPKPYRLVWQTGSSWRRPIVRKIRQAGLVLDWGKASALIKALPLEGMATDAEAVRGFVRYAADILEWARAYVEDAGAGREGGYFPFELTSALALSLGRLAVLAAPAMPPQPWQALAIYTKPERSFDLVGDFLKGMTREMIVSGNAPDEAFWSAWDPAAAWIMDHDDNDVATGWRPDRELQAPVAAAGFVGPYGTPVPPDWPHVDAVLQRVDTWAQATRGCAAAAAALLAFCERLNDVEIRRFAVAWIELHIEANRNEASFWSYASNADRAAAVVLRADDGRPDRRMRTLLAALADAGSLTARSALNKAASRRPGRPASP